MDLLNVIGIILILPLTIIVIAANLAKTEARRIRRLKERAEVKRWGGINDEH